MTGVQSDTGVLAGEERMLIDGELQHTASGALFDVEHPASEEVAGQATDGTVEDMERAVGAARRAFDTTDWSRDVEFRYHCLEAVAERTRAEQGAVTPHRGDRGRLPGQRHRKPDRKPDRRGGSLGRTRPRLRLPAGHRHARNAAGSGTAQDPATTLSGSSARSPRGTCRST